MAIIAPDHMLDERSSYEYLREIAHVDPTATRFASEKMLGLVDRLHTTRLPMTVPHGIGGVMLAILALRGYLTSERRCSGYLTPVDISTFLDGRSESHSVVTKTPRSASSASSRSNSAFSLSGSASANLRYLAARSCLMGTHLPTQYCPSI